MTDPQVRIEKIVEKSRPGPSGIFVIIGVVVKGPAGEPLGMMTGGGDRILRLHRFRFGLDSRRGGAQSKPRRSHRHYRLSHPLHDSLYRRRRGLNRHGPLSAN